MAFLFPTPSQTSLAVTSSKERFPVRRIFCVGKNYTDHIVEMGGNPDREEPFFFIKPRDAICLEKTVPFPPRTNELHYEIELVIAIGMGGVNLSINDALSHIYGYGVGVDLTRRDMQREAKSRGRPWAMAKGFDHSAPMSKLFSANSIGHPKTGRITLSVDGEIKQDGDIGQQVWKVPEIISNLSSYVALAAGDVIMTGTPAGVGSLKGGEIIEGEIEGIGSLTFTMEKPKDNQS